MNVETQGSVNAQLAFEVGVVGEEPAHEIALESETEYVTPQGERGFVRHTVEFTLNTLFVRQTDADGQTVVESVFRHDVPIERVADVHDVAVFRTEEIKGVVWLLYDKELSGHIGEPEIVADTGFFYFAERYGYGEVFYHRAVICRKDRDFRAKKSLVRRFFGQGSAG